MKPLQWAVVVFALCDLALTAGYYFQIPWATSTWPWPVGPLDLLLVSSFLFGATVVILWIGLTGEWGAATGATLNVGLMNLGASVYLFQSWLREHQPGLLHRALAFGLFAVANVGVLLFGLRHPIRDRRRVDKLLLGSFALFTAALLLVAVQLLRRVETIFPWTIEPETSTMFGWLFLGSAVYFFYGLVRPSWHNFRGQLLAFLAYDLVLIPPYLMLYPTVQPEHMASLRIYLAVLFYSTALAIYYLFINRRTRGWRIQEAPASDEKIALGQR